MEIPSFVGPLASTLLFLLTVFGFCFYYCYFKPKRQRRKDAEAAKNGTANAGSPNFASRSCPTRAPRKSSYDEEYYSGLSPYSAGYCFHGGFPIVTPHYEQNWQRPRKFQGPAHAVVNVIKKPKVPCGDLQIDTIKERSHVGPIPKHLYVCRQLSTESHGSTRSCHLQVIQECEEEKEEENEEISEINSKNIRDGCDVENTEPNTSSDNTIST